jgi:hypothetical protein
LALAIFVLPDFSDNAPPASGGKVPPGMTHLKIFAVAAAFGLGAYAAIQGLLHATKDTGFLEWLTR